MINKITIFLVALAACDIGTVAYVDNSTSPGDNGWGRLVSLQDTYMGIVFHNSCDSDARPIMLTLAVIGLYQYF